MALNYGVVVQNHLFEDRIMKSSYLKIGDECTVGNMSVILYDTEMKPRSSIDSMSLLMKGETLPPDSRWIGIPTRLVKGPYGPKFEQTGHSAEETATQSSDKTDPQQFAGTKETVRFDHFDTQVF